MNEKEAMFSTQSAASSAARLVVAERTMRPLGLVFDTFFVIRRLPYRTETTTFRLRIQCATKLLSLSIYALSAGRPIRIFAFEPG